MKRSCISFFLILFLSVGFAQSTDTIKVLFIGNSFTSNNNLPSVFQQLALGANKPVVVASYMPGGISVGDISQGTAAHMNNPIVFNLIRSNNWNYLVLQDNQGRFVNNYGIFPSSSLVIQGHIKIRDSLLYYHPCAKMIWFAGWGPKAGYLPYASTGVGLINKIYDNYRFLLDTAQQVIAPIGPAWERIIANDTTINLWDTDDTHPGIPGTSITADVVYSTVFKSSPIHSTYIMSGITSGVDSVLKNTAFQTVLDSIGFTGLQTITPVIVQNGNTLMINGISNCSWFLNGSFLIANTGTVTITQPGTYAAIVYDATHCEYRTLEYVVSVINAINEHTVNAGGVYVYPNPTTGLISIDFSNEANKIEIVNYSGQSVLTLNKPRTGQMIDVSGFTKGLYFVIVTDSNFKTNAQKLIVE